MDQQRLCRRLPSLFFKAIDCSPFGVTPNVMNATEATKGRWLCRVPARQ